LLRENTWKAIGDEMEVDGEFNENIWMYDWKKINSLYLRAESKLFWIKRVFAKSYGSI
jgi:hypothetical protein